MYIHTQDKKWGSFDVNFNAHLSPSENEEQQEEEEAVTVATVTHLHQGHGDALEVGGGVEGPADQGPQQLEVPQEHVERQQLPVVVGRPEEAGQRGGEAVEVLRQHLHERLAGAGAGAGGGAAGRVAVATVAPALRRRPQGLLTPARGGGRSHVQPRSHRREHLS